MMVWQRSICIVSLAVGAIGLHVIPESKAMAAPWLAPAAEEQINAGWVKDVAKALRTNRFKNVFMNQPFGCDQCRILEYLNDAAEALDNDEPKLAKRFVRRALSVLDDGVEDGWYDEADIRPIKRLMVKKAKKGFKEANAPTLAISAPEKQGRDPRYQQGDEPLFSRSDQMDQGYDSRRDRWSGYTSHRRLGLTNEPPDRHGRSKENSVATDRGPFSGRYLDEVQKLSRSGKQDQERTPFAGAYGNLVERWGNQADTKRMSRDEFRQLNQRQGAPESEQNRFDTVQELKEGANEQYDASPMRGPEGQIRQPGD